MMLMMALLAGTASIGQDTGGSSPIDRDRIDRARPSKPQRASALPTRRTSVKAKTAGGVVTGIRFQGAEAPGPVAEVARAFLGRQATVETLQELAGALSRAYEKTDVALYTVSIPEQDFAGGIVTVLLTEGAIRATELRGAKPSAHPLLRARIQRMTKERPLSRATMERQFMLIRAIPGLTIEPEFADPEGSGSLTLLVTPKQRRTRFTAGFSNRGVDLTGDGQFDAKAEFYGPFRDGDQLSLSGSASSDLRRYQLFSASYAVPVTSAGLTLAGSGAYLRTRPRGFPVEGTARLANVTLGYPLIRSFHRSADVSIGMDGIDSDNAVLGSIAASERTRALRMAASFADATERRSVSVGASVSRGLDVLGARVTQPYAETEFLKANFAAEATHAISKRAVARATLSGQYSRDRMPAAERFAVGGAALGRAFDTAFLSGDRGAGAVGEMAFLPLGGEAFGRSELYLFVDGALLGIAARDAVPGANLSMVSAGVGSRLRFREKGELGLEAARVVDAPYEGYDADWRLSLSWRLSL